MTAVSLTSFRFGRPMPPYAKRFWSTIRRGFTGFERWSGVRSAPPGLTSRHDARTPPSTARRPLRRVTAKPHRGARPESRRFRQNSRMAHRAQRTEARGYFFDKRLYRFAPKILGRKTVGDAAEIPQPASGLRQRYPDVPTAAFARLARLRHHGAERHQVTGGMIERL